MITNWGVRRNLRRVRGRPTAVVKGPAGAGAGATAGAGGAFGAAAGVVVEGHGRSSDRAL